MNEQQYMEKLGQSDHAGNMEKMGQANMYRDIPLEGNITAESPLPFLEMGSSFMIGLALGYFIKKSFIEPLINSKKINFIT